jgi:hypothetical protein
MRYASGCVLAGKEQSRELQKRIAIKITDVIDIQRVQIVSSNVHTSQLGLWHIHPVLRVAYFNGRLG